MRKSAEEKRQEHERARERTWRSFYAKLENAETYEDALDIHNHPVGTNAPGRSYYSNFGFFMHHFAPPDGGSRVELVHYLRLLRNFDQQGVLKEGAFARLEPIFEAAIAERR